jgi:3-hydroxyisobutyrate dehydrogenase-like beta-hydroxyacid dehydrogenase
MGAALAAVLVRSGHEVSWVSAGRSEDSARRAREAGLADAGELGELLERSEVVLSVCPPAAALDVAAEVARHGYRGVYVDANAVAPSTALAVAARVRGGDASYVDGGIVGPPPGPHDGPRLYLSGSGSERIADLFAGTTVDARVLAGGPQSASALKTAYAAWTKGSAALLLAAEAAARRAGVGTALAAEWSSMPGVCERLRAAHRDAATKGWRWVGEMEEGARAFADLGLPAGFHAASAEVFGEGEQA